MPSFDRLLDLPGGPVRVQVRGEGPPLLWSHGIFFPIDVDDHSTLGRLLSCLDGFTVVRWDARGHGRSPHAATPDLHRWDNLARDVIALADALGFERFFAGGISMGAATTLHAALLAPDRVRAMLLFALPTAWETRPAEQQRYRDLLSFATPSALAAHVQEDLDGLFSGQPLPASLQAMVAAMRASSWDDLSFTIQGASLSDLPPRERLASLPVRTVLRPWLDDSGHPISTAEKLRDTLPCVDYLPLGGFDDEPGISAAFRALRALGAG